MEHTHDITPVARIISRESDRRRKRREAEQAAEARAVEQLKRIAEGWSSARTTLLAEISTANMLLKLHKFEETYDLIDHAVRDVDNIAQFDLAIGRSMARASVCGYSGDLRLEHFEEGIPTFRCKRFSLNCLSVTREQLQDVLAVLLLSAFRRSDEDD